MNGCFAAFFFFFVELSGSQMYVFERNEFYSPIFMFQGGSLILLRYGAKGFLYVMRILAGFETDVSIYTVNIPDVAPGFRDRGI